MSSYCLHKNPRFNPVKFCKVTIEHDFVPSDKKYLLFDEFLRYISGHNPLLNELWTNNNITGEQVDERIVRSTQSGKRQLASGLAC